MLVSIFLEGGADALSVLSPQGDPLYRKLRPTLALNGGTALAEDSRLFWHPAMSGIAQLYGEHKVTVMPAIGYTHADQSHFTSRHYWEVGATDTRLNTGWLGRYLDVVGTRGQPAAGPLLRRHAGAVARDREGAGRGDLRRPDQYDFCSNRVWGEVQERMLETFGLFGAQPADPALRTAGGVAVQVDKLRKQLLPFQSQDGKPGIHQPRHVSDVVRRLPEASSPASPRCSARACRCARSR